MKNIMKTLGCILFIGGLMHGQANAQAGADGTVQGLNDQEEATPQKVAQKRSDTPSEKKYTVGLAAGMVGGLGLSVERWINRENAIQVNFAPYYIEHKYPDDGTDDSYYTKRDSGFSNTGFISLGAVYYHQLAQFRKFELLSFVGGNFMGIYDDNNYFKSDFTYPGSDVSPTIGHVEGYDSQNVFSLGSGIGGMLNLWRFELTALVGFVGAYDVTNKVKRITPSIDVSLHFIL